MALTTVQGELLESGAALDNIGAGNITPSYLSTQSQYTGFKNRIINGAMMIDQRNAGASVTATSGYTVDRWQVRESGAGSASFQQVTSAPTGFTYSLKTTVTGTVSPLSSSDRLHITQPIEGYNTADLAWGTANAATVTLSFWVNSSVTGQFGGSLQNAAADRSYVFTFTVNTADTWEQKTITIAGDTTGTWTTTNGIGVQLYISMAAGSTYQGTASAWQAGNYLNVSSSINLLATSGATFYITGVQLEKGSTATSFDYRPYGTELALCQRYTWVTARYIDQTSVIALGQCVSSNTCMYILNNPVPMRSTPSVSFNNQTYFRMGNAANSGVADSSSASLSGASQYTARLDFICGVSNLAAGNASVLFNTASGGTTLNGLITLSAEL